MTSIALYQALREAKVSEELAKRAVEENDDVVRRLDRIEVKVGMLQWTVGIVVALQLATIGLVLSLVV